MNFNYPKRVRLKPPIGASPHAVKALSTVKTVQRERFETGPWDGVFGGHRPGIVATSTALIGGAPGAGKSTLLFQIADRMIAVRQRPVIYIAAEQGLSDLKELADRLNLENQDQILMVPAMGREFFDPGPILQKHGPAMFVVDSLQAFVGHDLKLQLMLCKKAKVWADTLKAPGFLVSQVTKDIDLAGLMQFQHEVDGVYKLVRHDEDRSLRVFSPLKNRNGLELEAVFRMQDSGFVLRAETEDDHERE